jgi:spore germination cell wall hydrolase CwlJ-like protein
MRARSESGSPEEQNLFIAESNEIEYAAGPLATVSGMENPILMQFNECFARRAAPLTEHLLGIAIALCFGAIVSVTSLLTAGCREEGTRALPTTAGANALSELKALPGSPENVLSARLKRIGLDEARKLNAVIPFAQTPGSVARPFHFVGSVADRSRSTDCLALAAMAEAGGGDDGQRAVIQVILNRVRHPAFVKTVCGVVFQGSNRRTGCQFTFTCDGALARRYSTEAWASARIRATQALDGQVYNPVGLATHYHTDSVHPYWSDSLVKLARVDSHLFFRWPGHWGDAASLSVAYLGGEPAITQLASLPAHAARAEALAVQVEAGQAPNDAAFRDVVVHNGDGGAFVLLTSAPSVQSAREMGRSICLDRPSCKVFGWFERAAIPRGYPVPSSARAKLGFSYFSDANNGEIVLYDCARFAGVTADSCIPSSIGRRGLPWAKPLLSPVAVTSNPSAPGWE